MVKGRASNLSDKLAGRPALATTPVSNMTAVSSAARPMDKITPESDALLDAGRSTCRMFLPSGKSEARTDQSCRFRKSLQRYLRRAYHVGQYK